MPPAGPQTLGDLCARCRPGRLPAEMFPLACSLLSTLTAAAAMNSVVFQETAARTSLLHRSDHDGRGVAGAEGSAAVRSGAGRRAS